MDKYKGSVAVSWSLTESRTYKVEVVAEDEYKAEEKAKQMFYNGELEESDYGETDVDHRSYRYEVEDYEIIEEDVKKDFDGDWIDEYGNKLKDNPQARIPGQVLDFDISEFEKRYGKRVPEFLRRAQMTTKKRFIENLFNLKSSLADILRDDEQYLEADIKKLRNDARRLNRSDSAFEKLGVVDALTKLLDIKDDKYESSIEKYKRLNNFYNKYVVKPIKDNAGLFGIQLDLSKLQEKDLGTDVVQPSTLKLSPEVPSHLKLKSIPEISEKPRSEDWHNKLDDVSEMLKVLGEYIPEFEDWLRVFKLIDNDTTKIISLQNHEEINANIEQAGDFYELCGQIASRIKTARIMTVRASEIIYTLEELPRAYFLSPSANCEFMEVLWHNYLKSGKVDNILKRVNQLGEERTQLRKKFRQVFEQWSVLYEETAKQVGVETLKPIKLQLVRYGQQIVSAESLLAQMRELDQEVADFNDKLHSLVTDLYELYLAVKKGVKNKKVAQLRPVKEPVSRVDIPIEPEREIPEREVSAKPPKLPVGDEWLELVFEEDKDLYYSKGEKLTPPQAIALAGRNGLKIMMQYQKASNTGDPEERVIKNYVLEPYSYRIKNTNVRGRKKYLFGYDDIDGTIKAFLVGNIRAVQILPDPFYPKWEVEFY